MTLYAAGPLLSEPEYAPPALPRAVGDSCRRYLSLAESERMVLVVDETMMGSGRSSLVITNLRLVRFDKDEILGEVQLSQVHSIRLSSTGSEMVLVFNDYAGESREVPLQHVVAEEARTMLVELGERLQAFASPGQATRAWQCARCGPGEVIHLSRVHAGHDDGFLGTRTTVGKRERFWFSAYVCRMCGCSELFLEGAQTLPVDRIAVASLIKGGSGPYR